MTFPLPGYETAWNPSGSGAWGACRPLGSCTRRHEGQDIGAPAGTPMVAAADGLATKQTGGAGGNAVNVDTPDGTRYYYAHLSSWAGNVPGPVKEGDVIGYVGTTGQSSGPHLHFAIYRNGAAVDPREWLRAAAGGKVGTTAIGVDDIPIVVPGVVPPGLTLGDLGDLLDAAPGGNPFDAVSDVTGALVTIGENLTVPLRLVAAGLSWLADRDNWARIGQVSAGGALIGLGLVVLLRDVIGDAATVGLNPGGAVQGLADEGNPQ